MADIINTDNGSVAAGKVNDKLATAITESDSGSEVAAKVNAKTSAGYITSADSGSAFAAKINNAGGGGTGTTIRVMSYNVGHYSMGQSANSSLQSEAAYERYLADFKALLGTADILGIQEYNPTVYASHGAPSTIFGDYPFYNTGTAVALVYQAMFAKMQYNYIRETEFARWQGVQRFYQLAEFSIGGKTVGFVNAHCDTTNSGNNYRFEQMGEIVAALKDYTHAIIVGDFNIARVRDDGLGGAQWNLINYWVNGGEHYLGDVYGTKDFGAGYGGGEYTLASPGANPIGTWPATAAQRFTPSYAAMSCACDNVICKGFTLSNITRIDSDLSDHCALYADLTLID